MKKIRILLDYRAYPIWIYNEMGELIRNDLPDELKNETNLRNILGNIQITYESLFIDNTIEFRYKGFDDEMKKEEFLSQLSQVIKLIESRVGNIYKIENRIDLAEF